MRGCAARAMPPRRGATSDARPPENLDAVARLNSARHHMGESARPDAWFSKPLRHVIEPNLDTLKSNSSSNATVGTSLRSSQSAPFNVSRCSPPRSGTTTAPAQSGPVRAR